MTGSPVRVFYFRRKEGNKLLFDPFYAMAKVTTGSNKPVAMLSQSWAVYDLWANRMDDATAQGILNGILTAGNEQQDAVKCHADEL